MTTRPLPMFLKLLTAAALVLVVGQSISLWQAQREFDHYARAQLSALGQAVSYQTALNAGPMLLAQDWLSLNIALKQLTDAPEIQGAEVRDRQDQILAQAGTPGELTFEHPILVQEDRLGRVQVYLAEAPMEAGIADATRRLSLGSLLVTLLGLAGFYGLARHLDRPLQALRRAAVRIAKERTIERLDEGRRDEFGAINRHLNRRFAPPLPEEELPLQEQLEHLAEELRESLPEYATPDPNDQASPTDTASPDTSASDGHDEAMPAPNANTASDAATGPVPSADSHYLFYVDHRSGASDSLDADERATLLTRYRRNLEQVSQLYRGALTEDETGNWCVRFSPLSDDHSHGINALCAAQLFNGLYRGVNQQRIRDFSPVVNMKMALVLTGAGEGPAPARALCEGSETNELITDPVLFRVPPLQERLLTEAGYRVADEGGYLLTTLSPDYQALIDRQVEHFLKQSG